jgi:ABC-type multidrug transport system ATPase subunit
VSHTTYLYDELTAAENLRLYAQLYGVVDPVERAAALLSRVGLSPLADVLVGRLSRGQQQRIAIARALLHDPPVLLLDEPETGLDVAAFGLLEDIATAGARTVVLTTHNLAAGLRLGTRVAVLSRGRLVYEQAHVSDADAPALSERLEELGR